MERGILVPMHALRRYFSNFSCAKAWVIGQPVFNNLKFISVASNLNLKFCYFELIFTCYTTRAGVLDCHVILDVPLIWMGFSPEIPYT